MGSAVTKSIRREQFMVDVILNFNKASIANEGIINAELEQEKFVQLVQKIENLFKLKLCDGAINLEKQVYFEVSSSIKGPLIAQVCVFNPSD